MPGIAVHTPGTGSFFASVDAATWIRLTAKNVPVPLVGPERTSRALGDGDFERRLKKLGRVLRRQKPGPKKVETD